MMDIDRWTDSGRAPGRARRVARSLALLLLAAFISPFTHAEEETVIVDKTLVAWVTPGDLEQRGGSVLTIEKPGGVFDGIVFGELVAARWMAGSDQWKRSSREQDDWPKETASHDAPVQVAVVYRKNRVTIYRNGNRYASHAIAGPEPFGDDVIVLMGLRHLDAGAENRFFTGSIDDARLYGRALSAEEITALEPNELSDPPPLAWWDFEQGSATDQMRAFPICTLLGGARVEGGRLHLDARGAYLMASHATSGMDRPPAFDDAGDRARPLREALLADPHRPGYHFVTPEGRCMPFDPNGAIFWKGRYHLFYIFQDERGHNWGHVSSTDLFHWRHHPTGLVGGMFSGNCFVDEHGRPTMCYHQVGQGNALAVALDDDLNEWRKLESNPITPATSPGDAFHGKYRSWDPYGWFEEGTYYAIFGGKRPAIAKSTTLEGPWEYVGDLLANAVDGVAIDEDVSCADFFEIGDRHMLLCISHRLGCRYYLGDWRDERFHPTSHESMSWADNSFFAPESLLDDRGRRIMWAWIFDTPGFGTRMDHGWSGTMSLPRVLSLGDDGRLRIRPPEEIERLRYDGRSRENLAVEAETPLDLPGIEGISLELELVIEAPEARRYGALVCCSPDGRERTRVFYDADERMLKIDTTASSLNAGTGSIEAGPLSLEANEALWLRIFVDRSVVEVFANDRQAVMRRIYPSREDSLGVRLFSEGGPATVGSLRAWELMPSNPY